MPSWEIEFYRTEADVSPVANWIRDMPPGDQALALGYIEQLALLGTEAQAPLVKPLGNKLYELRWKASDKQYRIAYFAVRGRKLVLLHGFIKKTNTTPKQDKDKAQKRMRDYEGRFGS